MHIMLGKIPLVKSEGCEKSLISLLLNIAYRISRYAIKVSLKHYVNFKERRHALIFSITLGLNIYKYQEC